MTRRVARAHLKQAAEYVVSARRVETWAATVVDEPQSWIDGSVSVAWLRCVEQLLWGLR
jgi:hypothetical protein